MVSLRAGAAALARNDIVLWNIPNNLKSSAGGGHLFLGRNTNCRKTLCRNLTKFAKKFLQLRRYFRDLRLDF